MTQCNGFHIRNVIDCLAQFQIKCVELVLYLNSRWTPKRKLVSVNLQGHPILASECTSRRVIIMLNPQFPAGQTKITFHHNYNINLFETRLKEWLKKNAGLIAL